MPFITSTRILTLTLLAYAAGVWIGRYIPVPPIIPVIITAGYIISCQWLDPHEDRRILHNWLLAMLFSLGTLTIQVAMKNPIPEAAYGQEVTFKGIIAYDPDRTTPWYSSQARGDIATGEKLLARDVKVILYTKYNHPPLKYRYGDVIVATGELKQPSGQRNPGGFNYRDYLMTQGIFGTIHRIEQIKRVSVNKGVIPLIWSESVQRRIQGILARSEHSNVLRAMCLGERAAINPQTLESFQKSGAAHILAVSGLHVGLIAMFCFIALGQVLPKRAAHIGTMLAVICYALIIGASPSVLRATAMCLIFLGARALDKKLDIEDVLLLVAFRAPTLQPAQPMECRIPTLVRCCRIYRLVHATVGGDYQAPYRESRRSPQDLR